MPPPSRSPHLPHLGSPQTTRELYANAAPQLRRASELLSRSPSATSTMRGVPISPSSSSGFASPANLDSPQLANNQDGPPPLQATQHLYELRTTDGQKVRPEIIGKIDKGFFMAENDWTCYRRNYFQISCSYTLHPGVPVSTIHLVQDAAPSMQIHAFAMSISAVVDGENGKPIELVQHTPKRDKGPQAKPERIVLLPRAISPAMYGVSGDSSLGSAPRSLFDPNYSQASGQPPTEHTFERIQFKQATANNGKRRARQQYYHLIVELFADLGPQAGSDRWTEIARRTSVPMVVRGRSPGHYHNERRGSNASAGPGGSNGQGGGMGSYGSGGGIGRALGDMSMSGSSNILQGNNYGGSYDTSRSRRYLSSSGIDIPTEPIMPAEDDKSYQDLDGYYYYPHSMHEGSVGSGLRSQALPPYQPHRDDRGHLSMANYGSHNPSRVKQEFSGYSLPSLSAGPLDQFGRNCGRFEGVPTSRGYYPTAPFVHSEINSS
jgi:meiosis-specific transcription factor NDT80